MGLPRIRDIMDCIEFYTTGGSCPAALERGKNDAKLGSVVVVVEAVAVDGVKSRIGRAFSASPGRLGDLILSCSPNYGDAVGPLRSMSMRWVAGSAQQQPVSNLFDLTVTPGRLPPLQRPRKADPGFCSVRATFWLHIPGTRTLKSRVCPDSASMWPPRRP